ncbi:hypothetical protein Tco_0981599 [Tanacetum coccineum]
MCTESWGRSSYVRVMIELQVNVESKDTIMVAVLKFVGEGFSMCTIRIKYEWKPPRCSSCKAFGYILDEYPKKIISDVLKNVKNPRQDVTGVQVGPKQEVSSSNPFDALNTVENDDDFGMNEGNSKLVEKGAISDGVSSSHRTSSKTFDEKLVLVNDDGKPLKKVVDMVNIDSDSELEDVFNETKSFMA